MRCGRRREPYGENFASGGYTWTVCHVAMARGKVLSMLEVNRAEEQPTRDLMHKLAPVAADLLVSATEGS
ncbi:MAG: hypothetical protein ACRDTM_01065 [Micromonosporaceae bacterium]